MNVAMLAPVDERVPPARYGGTELVVSNLTEALVADGHTVTLFASGDSITDALLVPCSDQAVREMPEAANPLTRGALLYVGLARAVKYIQSHPDFDIVHNHAGWPALIYADQLDVPMLTTLHGSLALDHHGEYQAFFDNERYMYKRYKKYPFVSISDAQRAHAPNLNYIDTVYNGIDVSRFDFNDTPGDYLAFLGRIHRQKGPEFAIKIARDTGHRLIIGAKIDPDDREYFEQEIKPLIDGKQIIFLGEIGHDEKVELLKNAKAVVAPIQWDEPFGLVNIEAMACGTPVITIGRGSLPEIIEDGVSGYLCDTVEEMTARIQDIGLIDRKTCRTHVERYFSTNAMTRGYMQAYKKVIKQRA